MSAQHETECQSEGYWVENIESLKVHLLKTNDNNHKYTFSWTLDQPEHIKYHKAKYTGRPNKVSTCCN